MTKMRGLLRSQKVYKSSVDRPKKGAQDMNWEGLKRIKQTLHDVHLDDAAPSKPREQAILPRLQVFFDNRQGGTFRAKLFSTLLGRKMPRYFMWEAAHLIRKSVFRRAVWDADRGTFSASDFW